MTSIRGGRRRPGPAHLLTSAACTAALLLSAVSIAAPAAADDEVPTLGQVKTVSSQVKTDGDSTRDVLITVHGVRRLDDATAVYYSLGFTPESTAGQNKSDLMLMRGSSSEMSPLRGDVDAMGDVAILDIPDAQVYTTMYTGDLTGRSRLPLPALARCVAEGACTRDGLCRDGRAASHP